MDLTAYEYDSQRAYKSPKWQNNSNVSSTAKSRCVNRDLGQAKVAPFLFYKVIYSNNNLKLKVMALKEITKERKSGKGYKVLTNVCNWRSGGHTEILVGSATCLKCRFNKGKAIQDGKTFVNCKYSPW